MNLIYTICNRDYYPVWALLHNTLLKFNQFNNGINALCCLHEKTIEKRGTWLYHELQEFDYRFTAKYLINDWKKVSKVDNFLFLDVDILCTGDLAPVFEVINDNKDCIHGVPEFSSLNNQKVGGYSRFTEQTYPGNRPAYNAGTFGFNKKMLPVIAEFVQFIEKNKHLAICDQPLFNEFFVGKDLLTPSLYPFIDIIGTQYRELYSDISSRCILKHYAGNYADRNAKMCKMLFDYAQVMQL